MNWLSFSISSNTNSSHINWIIVDAIISGSCLIKSPSIFDKFLCIKLTPNSLTFCTSANTISDPFRLYNCINSGTISPVSYMQ